MEKDWSEEREMHEMRWRRTMRGNQKQAEGGGAGEGDEWRAAGVAAGQASCQGAPLTPRTERRERHEDERAKGGFRGEGE